MNAYQIWHTTHVGKKPDGQAAGADPFPVQLIQ